MKKINKYLTLFLTTIFILSTSIYSGYGQINIGPIQAIKHQINNLKNKRDQKLADEKLKLAENTKVLSETTVNQLTKQENNTLYFSKQATEISTLKTGSIVISTKGEGFLKKVTAINATANEYIVQTTTATLEEAFENLEIDFSKSLTQSDINTAKVQKFAPGVSLKSISASGEFYVEINNVVLDYDVDGSSIIANGSLTFKPDIDFKIVIHNFKLKEFKFVKRTQETVRIEISSKVKKSLLKGEKTLLVIPILAFTIPPIPVVFIPEFECVVGFDMNAGVEATGKVTQQGTFTEGVEFVNGTWNPVYSFPSDFPEKELTIAAVGEIKAYAGAGVGVKVYGIVGPYIRGYAFGKIKSEISPLDNTLLNCKLYGGAEAVAGVEMTIISIITVGYSVTLLGGEKEIKVFQIPFYTAPPSVPTLLSATSVSSTQINLSWTDNSNNETGFRIERKTGVSGTYTEITTVGVNVTTYNNIGLSSGTTYYYRIRAYNTAGNSTYSNETNAVTTTPDGVPSGMVLVPAGNFTMGSTSGDSDEQPIHTVYLNAYYIDKYEVTNGQYKQFINAGGYNNSAYWTTEGWTWKTSNSISQPYCWTNTTYGYNATNGPNLPVVGVSWYEAYAYATWSGKRLPTEAEWEKAARGTDSRTYPWGEGIDSTKCNYNDNIGKTTVVGSYESGKSPYGCYDMTGNVWEWCQDWYQSDYYTSSPASNPPGPTTGSSKLLRGGSFIDGDYYIRGLRCAGRDFTSPISRVNYLGFRCVK